MLALLKRNVQFELKLDAVALFLTKHFHIYLVFDDEKGEIKIKNVFSILDCLSREIRAVFLGTILTLTRFRRRKRDIRDRDRDRDNIISSHHARLQSFQPLVAAGADQAVSLASMSTPPSSATPVLEHSKPTSSQTPQASPQVHHP